MSSTITPLDTDYIRRYATGNQGLHKFVNIFNILAAADFNYFKMLCRKKLFHQTANFSLFPCICKLPHQIHYKSNFAQSFKHGKFSKFWSIIKWIYFTMLEWVLIHHKFEEPASLELACIGESKLVHEHSQQGPQPNHWVLKSLTW